jgi:hypothetical protein
MIAHRDRIVAALIGVLVLFAITIPYILAWRGAGADLQFNGFLLNPQDGNSYLAKMYQGWRGDLRFTLPYTIEKGNGAYLFIFYLVLGHLARLFDIPLLLMFHVARVASVLMMYVCLYRFISNTFDQVRIRLFAFFLAAIGSGLGWVALLFGEVTSDFWVAEAYPYLSAFSNPHFPIGLAIVLLLFTFTPGRNSGLSRWLTIMLSFFLAIIVPFGLVLVLVILTGLALWEGFPNFRALFRSITTQRLVWVGLGGIPVLLYDVLVTYQDPLLRAWNSQNQTPSPPVWDLIVSLSPVIILATIGIYKNYKRQDRSSRLLIVWAVLGLLMLYIPWGLQRRFMLGYYIPLSALAATGLGALVKRPARYALFATVITLLVIPTNLVIALTTFQAIRTNDARLYLTKGEVQALDWIKSQTPSDAAILAAPDTGLYIPAHTGRRVLYGHPFETVDADRQRERIDRFFGGKASLEENIKMLAEADFIFVGPREARFGGFTPSPALDLVYESQDIRIFAITEP